MQNSFGRKWREKSAARAAFFPAGQAGRARRGKRPVGAYWPPLTPEHGFPSLHGGPDAGRSPSVRSRQGRGAGFFPDALPFIQRIKKAADAGTSAAFGLGDIPAAALSASGQRVETDVSSQRMAPLSFAVIMAPGGKFVKGLAKPKKQVYNQEVQRGVRWRGLRGGCKAPTLKPDLGHANVGKMMGAYSRTAVFRRVRVFCFGQGQKEESV